MRSLVAELAVVAVALTLGAGSAQAATFTVDTTDDAGAGTLRQAIDDANAAPGADTIAITATGTIALTSPLPFLDGQLDIQGPGESRLAVDGGAIATVFSLCSCAHVTISDLTATNGMTPDSGGAVSVSGTLTLNRVTVSDSVADLDGGGIEVLPGAKLVANESTISGNRANVSLSGAGGGGINVESSATLTLRDSTVDGNKSSTDYGGVRVQGSASVERSTFTGNMALDGVAGGIGSTSIFEGGAGSLKLENSTLSGNSATLNGGGVGGYGSVDVTSSTIVANDAPVGANLVSFAFGSMTIQNSILAYPVNGTSCSPLGGTITSLGYNIDDDLSAPCGFAETTDQNGVDPKLGGLVNNGGPTLTRAPSATSPALNKGTAAGLTANMDGRVSDQRGVIRPAGAQADVGAVELASPTAVTGAASDVARDSAKVGGSATNPGVFSAQAYVQYGPASNPTQFQTDFKVIPAGTTAAPLAFDLPGLDPSTVYHYRLVVNNAEGSSTGEDKTFTTAAPPPPPPGPGPGPGPAPQPEPGVPTTIVISHRRVPLSQGKLLVALLCSAAPGTHCTGTLVLEPTDNASRVSSARRRALPRVKFDVPAGAIGSVRVSLPAQTKKQLGSKRKVVVKATATLTGGASTSRLLTVIRKF